MPHPGLSLFFEPLVLASRLTGPYKPTDRIDSGGFDGDVDYELTGERGGTWHCRISERGVSFARGPSPRGAQATISMAPETFFALLRGETSNTVAQMTGRVRVRGDGHAGIMLGAVVTQFRTPTPQPGARGWFTWAWRRGVLAAIGGAR